MARFHALVLSLASASLLAACGGNVVVDKAASTSTTTGTTTTTATSTITTTDTSTITSTTTTTDTTTTTSTSTTTNTTPVPACDCAALQGFLNGCGYPAPVDCAPFPQVDCACAAMAGGCSSLDACFGGGTGGSSPGDPGLPLACRQCFVKAIQGPCDQELSACKQNPECQAELDCHKACQYTAKCNADCDAQHPKGAEAYATLVMCADCGQCQAECQSTDLFATYCVYGAK